VKKLKDLLKESKVWERQFGESLPTLDSIQKKYNDKLSEGPSYEYAKVLKDIEKGENIQAKAVNNFVKVLKKKGFPKEATNVASTYMVNMRKFHDYIKELTDKLL
jgi:hypothetical protein|tara:strand:- start:240 stop:554 length:315 start_codon:yes stop_codon:yes gene_type:complete